MAQHYKLTEEKEPKIFKSVRRIAEYYSRALRYISNYRKDWNKELIYRKEVTKLPDDYKMDENDFIVLKVGKYKLEKSELDVECHIDMRGKVLDIYMVM